MTQEFHSQYIPKRNENLCLHKNVYTNIHCSSTHDSQNSSHPYNGILFGHKKEWNTDNAMTWMNLKNIMQKKKKKPIMQRRQTQKATQGMSPFYVKCPEQANPQGQKVDQ